VVSQNFIKSYLKFIYAHSWIKYQTFSLLIRVLEKEVCIFGTVKDIAKMF
jgi:hypothetical protein